MALEIGASIRNALPGISPESASSFYLPAIVDVVFAYDLNERDKLIGKIEVAKENKYGDEISGLANEEVEFIISKPDRMYLSQKSFESLREWGLVSEGFYLKVTLDRAVVSGKEKTIFTKRDISYEL